MLLFAVAATLAVGATGLLSRNAAAATTPTTSEACLAQGGTWGYQGSSIGCSGATFALSMSLEQQVQSFIYYRTLGYCATQGGDNLSDGAWPVLNGQRINQANAKNGTWFGGSSAYGGGFLNGVNGINAPYNDANVLTACNQASLVNGALKLWGEWAPDEALCSFGYRRADDGEANAGRCTDGQGGSDEFMKGSSVTAAYKQAVKSRVYGGKEPAVTANTAWTNAGKYLLYLNQLKLVCVPKATISTTAPTGSTDRDYALRTPTRGADGVIVWTTTYYTGLSNKKHSDGANAIVVGSDFGGSLGANLDPSLGGSCGALLNDINGESGENNGLADAYAKWLADNASARDSTNVNQNPEEETSSCNIDGVGWLLCPILTAGASLADASFAFLADSFLKMDVSLLNTDSSATAEDGQLLGTGTFSAWKVMQGFANVAFVIAFLIIIFSQLTSVGVSNYGVKKLLPRVIIAAVLVNISFFICQLAVDLSNIAGFGLKSLLEGIAGQVTTAGGATTGPDESGHLGGILITVLALTGGALWIGVGAIGIAILGALVSLLVVFVLLVVRKALIVLLIVLAPLAFVAYLLPNTEPLFQRWRKLLTGLLLLFPIIGLLYGAGLLASAVLLQTAGDDIVMQITGYFVLVVPLLAAYPLLKGSLDGVGKLGAAIQNAGNKTRSGVQGGAKGGAKRMSDAYKNSSFGKFRSGVKAKRKAQIEAGVFEGANSNPLNWSRNLRSRGNRKLNNSAAINTLTGGYGTHTAASGASLTSKMEDESVAAADTLMEHVNLDAAQRQAIALGGTVTHGGMTFRGSDIATRKAAIKRQASSSHDNVKQLVDAQMSGELGRYFARAMTASGSRPTWMGQGVLEDIANGTAAASGNDSDFYIAKAIAANAYSPEKIASGDQDELGHVLRVAGSALVAPGDKAKLGNNARAIQGDPRLQAQVSKNAAQVRGLQGL